MAMSELRLQMLSVDLLGNVLGVAILGAALSLVWGLLRPWISSRNGGKGAKNSVTLSTTATSSSPFDVMGEIEPLHDLDLENEKPMRIYKFADKYNLTMGNST